MRCGRCAGLIVTAYDHELRREYRKCLNCGGDPDAVTRQGSKCKWVNCLEVLAEPGFCEQHQKSRIRSPLSRAEREQQRRERKRLAVQRYRAKKKAQQVQQEAA